MKAIMLFTVFVVFAAVGISILIANGGKKTISLQPELAWAQAERQTLAKDGSRDDLKAVDSLVSRIKTFFPDPNQELKIISAPVRPVIFVPVGQSLATDTAFVSTSLGVVQAWYQNQLGFTFELKPLVVVWGAETINYYDELGLPERMLAVRTEAGVSESAIFFVLGSQDQKHWSFQGYGTLVGQRGIEALSRDSISRWRGIATLAHELGHVWGLDDVRIEPRPSASIMEIGSDYPLLLAGSSFPLAYFSAREKNILLKNMVKGQGS